MPPLRRPLNPRSGNDAGQTTIEWLGIVAVVAAIITALILSAPGLGETIARNVECLISTVTGGGGCSGEDSAANPGEPARACVTSSTEGRVTINGRVLVIDAETGDAYIREEKSDGTVEVTFIEEGSLGASVRAGGKAKGTVGDVSAGGGAEASAGAAIEGYVGETRVFDDPAEADQYIQDRITDEAIETLPPGVEQGAGLVRSGIDWITGHETPTGEEGSQEGGVGGKIEAKAEGAAGPVTASVEAAVEAGAKVKVMPDGSMEVTVDVAADASGNISVVKGQAGSSGSVTIKLDPDGRPVEVQMSQTVSGELGASLDIPGMEGVDLPVGGGAGREQAVTVSVDLTDPGLAAAGEDLIDQLGGAIQNGGLGGVLDAADNLVQQAGQASTVTVEAYEIDDFEVGAEASGNVGVGVGAGVNVSKANKELISAQYWDPVANEFVPWVSCTG